MVHAPPPLLVSPESGNKRFSNLIEIHLKRPGLFHLGTRLEHLCKGAFKCPGAGIRWGVSPAAQMGCLRNRSGSPSGADQP